MLKLPYWWMLQNRGFIFFIWISMMHNYNSHLLCPTFFSNFPEILIFRQFIFLFLSNKRRRERPKLCFYVGYDDLSQSVTCDAAGAVNTAEEPLLNANKPWIESKSHTCWLTSADWDRNKYINKKKTKLGHTVQIIISFTPLHYKSQPYPGRTAR